LSGANNWLIKVSFLTRFSIYDRVSIGGHELMYRLAMTALTPTDSGTVIAYIKTVQFDNRLL